MIQKKICLLGSFAVGKTSLVRRYVDSIFLDSYHTTIGVKIDKKETQVHSFPVSLVLWDIHGEDDFQTVLPAYFRGMSGFILVVDPTRPMSFDTALQLRERTKSVVGVKPYVLALNKADQKPAWQLDGNQLQDLSREAVSQFETSAKTGDKVDQIFSSLAAAILEPTESA